MMLRSFCAQDPPLPLSSLHAFNVSIFIHPFRLRYFSCFCQMLQIQIIAVVHMAVCEFSDILVLGTGDVRNSPKLNKCVHSFMANHRISIEVLTTQQACATFNFLNSESRYIAGALIPPLTLQPTDDDVIMSKKRYNMLYGSGDGL